MTQFVTIKINEFDEYEVPTPTEDAPDSIYYTDDKGDAFMTARHHHGINAPVAFARGTYGEQS